MEFAWSYEKSRSKNNNLSVSSNNYNPEELFGYIVEYINEMNYHFEEIDHGCYDKDCYKEYILKVRDPELMSLHNNVSEEMSNIYTIIENVNNKLKLLMKREQELGLRPLEDVVKDVVKVVKVVDDDDDDDDDETLD